MTLSKAEKANRPPKKGAAYRQVPLEDWSEADRAAWLRATTPSKGLRRGGSASRHEEGTNEDLQLRYSYFLFFLMQQGLPFSDEPAGHVTQEHVKAFVADMQAKGLSSVTIPQTLWKLKRMVDHLAPGRDLIWLTNLAKDYDDMAEPDPRYDHLVTTTALVREGLTMVEEGKAKMGSKPVRGATLIRNGVMLALMALCPIRLLSFAGLDLGRSMIRQDDGYWIALSAKETKSDRADEREVPDLLTDVLDVYLDLARPVLIKAAENWSRTKHAARPKHARDRKVGAYAARPVTRESGPLWISPQSGTALSYAQVAGTITQITEQTLGVRVAPHDVRRAAATQAAILGPETPDLASALLQHSDQKTTNEHYNRAKSFVAAGRLAGVVERMRGGSVVVR